MMVSAINILARMKDLDIANERLIIMFRHPQFNPQHEFFRVMMAMENDTLLPRIEDLLKKDRAAPSYDLLGFMYLNIGMLNEKHGIQRAKQLLRAMCEDLECEEEDVTAESTSMLATRPRVVHWTTI